MECTWVPLVILLMISSAVVKISLSEKCSMSMKSEKHGSFLKLHLMDRFTLSVKSP